MDIQVNKRTEPYGEDKARKYFRDIVLGLEYCKFSFSIKFFIRIIKVL